MQFRRPMGSATLSSHRLVPHFCLLCLVMDTYAHMNKGQVRHAYIHIHIHVSSLGIGRKSVPPARRASLCYPRPRSIVLSKNMISTNSGACLFFAWGEIMSDVCSHSPETALKH